MMLKIEENYMKNEEMFCIKVFNITEKKHLMFSLYKTVANKYAYECLI